MASLVVHPNLYRGNLYFYISKAEAIDLLALLRRAAAYPGRVRWLSLTPADPKYHAPETCRAALRITADAKSPYSVGIDDLKASEPKIVFRPDEDTELHHGLREVIDGGWDFSVGLALLNPVRHSGRASIALVFL